MNATADEPTGSDRWQVRARTSAPDDGAPAAAEVLQRELVRIERRIDAVISQGREAFVADSDSYDRATVAVIRLAALFEEEQRYAPYLSVATLEERRGIATTRNIAAHSGYGAMNTEVFWHTVTERLPEIIARVRAAHRL